MITLKDIKKVSAAENIPVKDLSRSIKKGEVVVVASGRGIAPVGIGRGLRAKFATIVGTSSDKTNIDSVIRKAKIAVRCGASIIHNGSTGGEVDKVQKALLETVTVPLAACHPLAVMANACRKKDRFVDVPQAGFIKRVQTDIEQGVEVILLPLGVTKKTVGLMSRSRRLMPCCGKSGSIMAAWMLYNKKENPYCLYFDEILKMAKERSVTLSVVGAFRSGCLHDSLDGLQYEELKVIKEYVDRSKRAGVQIKAGSGGHMPADKISDFFSYQKGLLKTPIISFGPQVTDVSLGFDHVSAAMGQLIALMSGADIIFSITPAEHIAMPDGKETQEGCVTARLVCHSADVARSKDLLEDFVVSKARSLTKKGCSICGEFCAHELKNFMKKGFLKKR